MPLCLRRATKITKDSAGAGLFEDTPVGLSFQQLYFATDLSDVDDEVLTSPDPSKTFNHRFVVKAIQPDSKLLVDGVEVSVGAEILRSANTITWIPPRDAFGDNTAFHLRVRDENPLGAKESSADIPFVISLAEVNDPPVLAIPENENPAKYRLTGAQEDIPYVLTYDAVKARLAIANKYYFDVD